MNEHGQLTDTADTEWQHCMQQQEYETWLRDQDAQREYQSWLDLINQLNSKDSAWDATQQTQVVEISNPHPRARTSLVASS